MKIWVAKDNTRDALTTIFTGEKPVIDNMGIWYQPNGGNCQGLYDFIYSDIQKGECVEFIPSHKNTGGLTLGAYYTCLKSANVDFIKDNIYLCVGDNSLICENGTTSYIIPEKINEHFRLSTISEIAEYRRKKHFFQLGLKASNPLTWEDMFTIFGLVNKVLDDYADGKTKKEIGEEVLKRFNLEKYGKEK